MMMTDDDDIRPVLTRSPCSCR